MADWRSGFGAAMLAGALLGMSVAPAAPAQDDDEGEAAGAMEVERAPERKPRGYADLKYALTQYEVETFSEMLELTPEQHGIVMSMFEEVQRRFITAQLPVTDAMNHSLEFFSAGMKSIQESEEPDKDIRLREYRAFQAEYERLNRAAYERQAEFRQLQQTLSEEFFSDLNLLLTPEQAERADGMFRWRHRFRYLRQGHLPYLQFSVADVARSLDLRPDPEKVEGAPTMSFEEVYLQYERELDRLLLQRLAIPRDGKERGTPEEMAKYADTQKRVGQVNLRMVSMQKKYIRQIAYLTDAEAGREFEEQCRRLAYPFIVSGPREREAVDSLLAMAQLAEDQRTRLEDAWGEYSRARDRITERWIRAFDALIAEGRPHILAANSPGFHIGDIEDPEFMEQDCWRVAGERRELDKRWAKQLQDLRVEFGLDGDAEAGAE